jgi:hypothetical protein
LWPPQRKLYGVKDELKNVENDVGNEDGNGNGNEK